MKRVQITLILLVFIGLSFTPFFARADGGRFFIKSKSNFWLNTIGARNVFEHGFTADLSDLQLGILTLFRVDIEAVPVIYVLPDTTVSPEPSRGPAESGKVIKIAPVKGKKTPTTRYVPSDQTPWGIETIYDNLEIAETSGGTDVKVAVLDTGVNINHPDLKNRIFSCKDFTNFRFPVVNNQCEDKNGHGTHVAGVIAADGGQDGLGIYGVAPESKIMAYKVCDMNGACYADDIANGLIAAANDGAQVVNMSFGSDRETSLISDAVAFAADHGVLMVAAAGNDGPYVASSDYPGAYSSVVAVGALGQNLQVTDWSSRGINPSTDPLVINNQDIEFATPGENIESTWKSGGYAILSGTSMASPFVAGLAAKYWQSSAVNQAELTRDFLHSLAKDLPPVDEDNDSGLGLPQVQS